MPSPIINTTIQACVLATTSNIIAQLLSAYRNNAPFSIDWKPVFQFILFTTLNCPPNFLWQSFLESSFPSTHLVPSSSAIRAASNSNEKELDREQKADELLESQLSIKNTLIKFSLDQTFGAAINTLLFSFVMAGFKGANLEQAGQICRQDFWGLMSAGWRLWPLVSLVNFTMIKTVEKRNLVGGLAGMGWGVYLSLLVES